jgi:hypothetical protein
MIVPVYRAVRHYIPQHSSINEPQLFWDLKSVDAPAILVTNIHCFLTVMLVLIYLLVYVWAG